MGVKSRNGQANKVEKQEITVPTEGPKLFGTNTIAKDVLEGIKEDGMKMRHCVEASKCLITEVRVGNAKSINQWIIFDDIQDNVIHARIFNGVKTAANFFKRGNETAQSFSEWVEINNKSVKDQLPPDSGGE